MAVLPKVLGVVLCIFTVSSEIVPQADFNAQGMAGKWYLVGFATNADWFLNHKANMKMGTAMFNPTADGDMEISYASLNPDGSCWRMNNFAKKTDVPGKFTYTSRGNHNDMRMFEVKYDEYALTHTMKSKAGDNTVVSKLYGRAADLSSEVVNKFKQFSMENGILPENVAVLPKNGECPAS